MTFARMAGLALVTAGIVAGTMTDRIPERAIPRHGTDYVLQGDFHVHAFPGDGGLAAWELAREARRRGLDVIAVTNHNQRLAARLAAAVAIDRPADGLPIVIPGQEVTTPHFHMIAAGVMHTIDWRLAAADAIRAVQQQGGVAIAAHPVSEGPLTWIAQGEQAFRLLDGAEAAHPLVRWSAAGRQQIQDFYRTAGAVNPSLAAIGSADSHWGGWMGSCRTFLFVREVSERAVLDAIREARTVAYDGEGQFTGDPALVAAAREALSSNPVPARMPASGRVPAALALAGLAVLLLFA
jgi:predicted metal-dependent phosphoesterase TrpH